MDVFLIKQQDAALLKNTFHLRCKIDHLGRGLKNN